MTPCEVFLVKLTYWANTTFVYFYTVHFLVHFLGHDESSTQ